jgi:phenylacetate-CoA ligase
MAAAGLTAEDRVFIPFSFGPFVGFWAAFEAAADMGCFVLPAGGMSTSARLRYLQAHRADIVCCTPTYALRMAEVAEVDGVDLASGSVRCLIVGGEPGGSIPATRSRIETAWGARVFDHAGSTEAGAWGFETVQDAGILQVNELEFVSEVLDTETLVPVDAGQEGELVLTNLGRLGSPLIRYRTGDRVRLASGQSDRGAMRLEGGILGRVDDMILVRGVNVFPSAIEGIVRRYAEISEFVIIWDQSSSQAELSVNLEIPQAKRADEVVGRVEADIRNDLHIRAVVSVIPAGSLPKSDTKSRRLIKRVDPGISENVARKQT